MYMFELMANYHLPEEQLVSSSDKLISLFLATLQDGNIAVKVSALQAITAFLSSIEDEDIVMKYSQTMDGVLEVVI
jgi:hypothetical protein